MELPERASGFARVTVAYETEDLGGLDPTTLRLFFIDEKAGEYHLVAHSWPDPASRSVHGLVHGDGVYAVVGLPERGLVLDGIREMARIARLVPQDELEPRWHLTVADAYFQAHADSERLLATVRDLTFPPNFPPEFQLFDLPPLTLGDLDRPVVLGDFEPPGPPTGLTATPGDRQITLAWSPPAELLPLSPPPGHFSTPFLYDGDNAVDHYVVYREDPTVPVPPLWINWFVPSPSQPPFPSDGSFVDHQLVPGVTYSYFVRAVDAAGNKSAASDVASATPFDGTAPTVPTGLTATPGIGKISLSWIPSTDDTAVDHYDVLRDPAWPTPPARTSNTTTYVDSEVNDGVLHTYRVVALDPTFNRSSPSQPAGATPLDVTPPTQPTGLVAHPADGRITISWDPSSDNVRVVGYRVFRSLDGGVTFDPNPAWTPTQALTDQSLTNGSTYTYEVRAVDGAGNVSVPSQQISATPKANMPAPTGELLYSAGGHGVTGWYGVEIIDTKMGRPVDLVPVPAANGTHQLAVFKTSVAFADSINNRVHIRLAGMSSFGFVDVAPGPLGCCFSADGRTIFVKTWNEIQAIDTTTSNSVKSLVAIRQFGDPLWGSHALLAISPDGSKLATVARVPLISYPMVAVVDLASTPLTMTSLDPPHVSPSPDWVLAVAFVDNAHVVVLSSRGDSMWCSKIRVIDGQILDDFRVPEGAPYGHWISTGLVPVSAASVVHGSGSRAVEDNLAELKGNVLADFPNGTRVASLAFNSKTNRVYALHENVVSGCDVGSAPPAVSELFVLRGYVPRKQIAFASS